MFYVLISFLISLLHIVLLHGFNTADHARGNVRDVKGCESLATFCAILSFAGKSFRHGYSKRFEYAHGAIAQQNNTCTIVTRKISEM